MKEKTMNIQLNQNEIIKAIHQYVEQQGISLRNKTLAVAFTSGRKENGLSADLTIEDAGIPGFGDATGLQEKLAEAKPVEVKTVKVNDVLNTGPGTVAPPAEVKSTAKATKGFEPVAAAIKAEAVPAAGVAETTIAERILDTPAVTLETVLAAAAPAEVVSVFATPVVEEVKPAEPEVVAEAEPVKTASLFGG